MATLLVLVTATQLASLVPLAAASHRKQAASEFPAGECPNLTPDKFVTISSQGDSVRLHVNSQPVTRTNATTVVLFAKEICLTGATTAHQELKALLLAFYVREQSLCTIAQPSLQFLPQLRSCAPPATQQRAQFKRTREQSHTAHSGPAQ